MDANNQTKGSDTFPTGPMDTQVITMTHGADGMSKLSGMSSPVTRSIKAAARSLGKPPRSEASGDLLWATLSRDLDGPGSQDLFTTKTYPNSMKVLGMKFYSRLCDEIETCKVGPPAVRRARPKNYENATDQVVHDLAMDYISKDPLNGPLPHSSEPAWSHRSACRSPNSNLRHPDPHHHTKHKILHSDLVVEAS